MFRCESWYKRRSAIGWTPARSASDTQEAGSSSRRAQVWRLLRRARGAEAQAVCLPSEAGGGLSKASLEAGGSTWRVLPSGWFRRGGFGGASRGRAARARGRARVVC